MSLLCQALPAKDLIATPLPALPAILRMLLYPVPQRAPLPLRFHRQELLLPSQLPPPPPCAQSPGSASVAANVAVPGAAANPAMANEQNLPTLPAPTPAPENEAGSRRWRRRFA